MFVENGPVYREAFVSNILTNEPPLLLNEPPLLLRCVQEVVYIKSGTPF